MARIEQTGAITEIIFEQVGGDLVIQGHSGLGFQIDGDDPEIHQNESGAVFINCGGDCTAAVPDGISVKVISVGGDGKVTHVTGEVLLDQIGGDLVLRHVTGQATLGNVGGDLSIRHVTGTLTIGSIGSDLDVKHCTGEILVSNIGSDVVFKNINGNLNLENVGSDLLVQSVNGDLKVEEVGSDLSITDLKGSCYCPSVHSDIVLTLAFDPEKTYLFGAEGDIVCMVIPGTHARFVLPSDVEVECDEIEDAAYQRDNTGQLVLVGDGGAEIQITEAESFNLVPEERSSKRGFSINVDFDNDVDEMVNNIENTINQSLRGLGERLEQQTQQAVNAATNFSTGFFSNSKNWSAKAEAMARRAREQAERAREQAERLQERAQRRQERFAEQSRERQERFQQRFEGGQKAKRTGEWEPVSQQERLVILEMLQNGSITVDQAEQLLKTLEGEA
ncbi:MAG: hypothetical protein BroJett018_11130 [Chloroflexota bacterium]|nr:hypothetical protein [Chloroflexota bacterium]NOG64844.1 hypothetical protein [Chloroflexota bacterium]GIK63319.1 MAG: hypothetical protein BroJett018_11130 [Chloroflexota bacterium]